MITINFVTEFNRKSIVVSSDNTLREVLNEQGVNPQSRDILVDGVRITPAELDETLADIGMVDDSRLSIIARKDNA